MRRIYIWPKAIHEGNGKVAFVVDPATTDKQVDALAQIFTGKLGGMPWEVLGPTAEVVGLVKARITIEGTGRKSTFRAEGVGEGRGDTFKNPVTGEDHLADVNLPERVHLEEGRMRAGIVPRGGSRPVGGVRKDELDLLQLRLVERVDAGLPAGGRPGRLAGRGEADARSRPRAR